jgi:hypothetical protein
MSNAEMQPSIDMIFQVRFSLASSPVFSRTDTATDSERFYNSILDLFEDPDEQADLHDLILWWNRYAMSFVTTVVSAHPSHRQIFPTYSSARRAVCKNSVLNRIRERRAALGTATNNAPNANTATAT